MTIRLLIADDDERERIVLRYIIEQIGEVKIIGEAGNGMEAILLSKEKKPDLVFLDIFMPELDGMETARRLRDFPSPPFFAFITSRPEHAVEAFELDALDYIIKPLDPNRIRETIERTRKRLGKERLIEARVQEKTKERLNYLVRSLSAQDITFDRLPIKERGKVILVDQDEIIYAESQGKRVHIHTLNSEYRTSYTLSELETRLDHTKFFRAHQAFIVNMNRIKEIVIFGEGSYQINLDRDDKQILLSRSKARLLRRKLGI